MRCRFAYKKTTKNPAYAGFLFACSSMVEQPAVNRQVSGSSSSEGAVFYNVYLSVMFTLSFDNIGFGICSSTRFIVASGRML